MTQSMMILIQTTTCLSQMMGRAKGESPLALRMMMTPKSDNSDEEGIAEGNNEALEQEAETVADQPNLETVEPHVHQEL